MPNVNLLDDRITISWLFNLGAVVLSLLGIALALGRKMHLSSRRWLFYAAPIASAVLTAFMCLVLAQLPTPIPMYVAAVLLGPCEAATWILWGERYACTKANFTICHIGAVFGTTVLAAMAITWALPLYVATVFVALMPLASGALLILACKDGAAAYPVLLPQSAANAGAKNMFTVSGMTLIASTACYFLVAIIPWELLPTTDLSFTIGIVSGGIIMLIITGIYVASRNKLNIFKLFPTLLVLELVAFALFQAGPDTYFAAFLMATGVSAVFEIMLIMYFGVLTSKGYATPALAFAFAGAFVRAGIAFGNTWAVGYESMPELAAAITPETCLALMCVVAALLIPLVRQEYNIVSMTAAPPSKAEIDEICDEVSKEFGLSAREAEILLLIARGYTTNAMAEKLVISPYTVNTHIRHIYEKMQIHKRSELLNYLNMQRSDY